MKNGWKTKTLGEVCSFLNRGISPRYLERGGICVLNQKCIRDHRVSYELSRRHDAKAKKVGSERLIQAGDVLVNSTGTGTLGRVAQLRDNPPEPTTVDSHVTIVRPTPGKFYPKFFGYMLVVIEDVIKEAGEGCGGQTELARSVLAEKFRVHYPESFSEQQRIVGILDEAFAGIATAKANAEKNLQNARTLFESHLQSIFTQPGEGWEQKTLEQIATIFGRGKSRHRPRNEEKLYGGKYPFIQTGDIRNADHLITEFSQTYSEAGLTQSKLWPKGTVCITIAANIAETGILDFDACFPDSVIGVVANPKEADVGYIEYLLQSFKVRLQAKGKGSAQANINMGTFEHERFPFPSVAEQKRIVTKLESLREETRSLESIYQRKLAALETLKESLLHQAFAGQLTADSIAVSASASIRFPTELEGISTTDLHAGILALSHQFHEKAGKLEHFGHVKAEKIAHMIEACLGIELGRKPMKDAAGPNDFPHLHKVEYRARKANYFDFKRVEGASYRVHKLRSFDRLIERTRAALGGRANEVDGLLELMLPMQTQQAEIFCTVYAAWNNLLLDRKRPTDEEIVFEARENWHPDKLKIPRERFFSAIEGIRNKALTPSGKGKKVCNRVE